MSKIIYFGLDDLGPQNLLFRFPKGCECAAMAKNYTRKQHFESTNYTRVCKAEGEYNKVYNSARFRNR